MSTAWTAVPKQPTSGIIQLLPLNKLEFIGMSAPWKENGNQGIWKFNTINNEWINIMKYPENYPLTKIQSSTIDVKNNIIYSCCHKNYRIFGFNLNKKSMVDMGEPMIDPDVFYHILFYQNKFHHFTWNLHYTSNGAAIHTIVDIGYSHYARNGDGQSIWPFVNVMENALVTTYCDYGKIQIIKFDDNKWYNTGIENCDNLYGSKIVETTTRDYWIFIGGRDFGSTSVRSLIHVYDIKNKKMNRSNITLPSIINTSNIPENSIQAIITRNESKENMLLHGFIKQCYKNVSFKNMTKLPLFMIDNILKFCCFERFDLVCLHSHWTIDVDEIINGM